MIFINNKYKKWYDSIIHKRKTIQLPKQKNERHHILPKCLGGTDDPENLVNLTHREHFLSHRLLCKFTTGNSKYKMKWALHRMSFSKKYIVNSHTYEIIKKDFSSFLINNHPSKRSKIWLEKVKIGVFKDWENNETKRINASNNMKKLWEKGKIKAKLGPNNGMYNKKPWNYGKKLPENGLKGKTNPMAKTFIIYDDRGNKHITECLKTFCDENNISYDCMKQVSRGKSKQHKGFTIKQKEGRS